MTKEKRLELIQEAKDLGLKSITIDGIVYEFGVTKQVLPPTELTEEQVKALVNPMSVLDDYSEDEITYYATPYFDEIQEQKKIREQQLKDEATKNG